MQRQTQQTVVQNLHQAQSLFTSATIHLLLGRTTYINKFVSMVRGRYRYDGDHDGMKYVFIYGRAVKEKGIGEVRDLVRIFGRMYECADSIVAALDRIYDIVAHQDTPHHAPTRINRRIRRLRRNQQVHGSQMSEQQQQQQQLIKLQQLAPIKQIQICDLLLKQQNSPEISNDFFININSSDSGFMTPDSSPVKANPANPVLGKVVKGSKCRESVWENIFED